MNCIKCETSTDHSNVVWCAACTKQGHEHWFRRRGMEVPK